jgi:N-acetylneuraminic acid mutarotase
MKWSKVSSHVIITVIIILIATFIAPENSRAGWVHSLVINLSDADDWTLVGEDDGDWTAYFASPAGDVNGDGLGDALIGAPMAGVKICPYPLNPDGSCPGLPKGPGAAYLVLGRQGDLPTETLNLEFADASFLGCEVNSMYARQLYAAGDVNGDGYDDILISGWKCGENYRGKAYLFLGRADVSTWGRFFPTEQADASFLGENEWDFLSYYVATAGDVNDDGFDDFLITATHHEYDEPCPPGTPDDCVTCCKNFNTSAELFSVENDSWSQTGGLNVERMDHTAVNLDGKVLVAGGQNSAQYLDSTEIFDPALGSWVFGGTMLNARSVHSMNTLNNNKVLVAGGQNESGVLASAELYDPSAGTWAASGNMNTARMAHTATVLSNGKVLVVGGRNGDVYLTSAELYDPATGAWTSTGNLTNARSNHTANLLPGGRVVVIGGQDGAGPLASTEIYDPDTGLWTSWESMTDARANHTATILADSNLLLVAGGNGMSRPLDSSELLNLSTGTWEETNPLKHTRANHTAILLPDGRVVAAGGQNDGGTVVSYEYYDPATTMWEIGPAKIMGNPRSDHIAVLIDNSTVLLAGGRDCTDFGKVYLILGRQAADWGSDFDVAIADASFVGEALEDRIGRSATGVGDVNGDGFDDFLIGAKSSDSFAKDAGENYLFLGRATPGDPRYDDSKPWWGVDYSVAWADASFTGEAEKDESGRRVAAAGDVNGDGLDDMLMQAALNDHAAPDAGITYLVLGRQAADWGMRYSLAYADASFVGENKRDQSGRRMSGAGDVNNDGYDDFLTGAPHNEDGSTYDGIIAGKSYLIYGRPEVDWGLYFPLSMADVIHVGKPEIGVAGYDNANLDDFNGDGIDDYLIAAYGGRNNDHTPGEAYIFLGSETPVATQFFSNYNRALFDYPIRFVAEFWEPNGWQDIQSTEVLVEDKSGAGTGFFIHYDHTTNGMYLFDYTINDWLGPCTPGEGGRLANSVIQLECKGSSIIVDERHAMRVVMRLRWLVEPYDVVEGYNASLRVVDYKGNDTWYVDFGGWPVAITGTYIPFITK